MAFSIRTYDFKKPVKDKTTDSLLSEHAMGRNWPVVYILHGNGELYVGETSNAFGRIEQHLDPKAKNWKGKREKMQEVEIIFDSTFNKSAILDIEQSLINLFRYEIVQKKISDYTILQNGNGGQSNLHNYYHRAHYQQEVEDIWEELKNRKIAKTSYQEIVNDSIFKFSPYTNLNEEQQAICINILNNVMDVLEGKTSDYTAIVKGSAGTGKTIVLLHMLTMLMDAAKSNLIDFDVEEDMSEEELIKLDESRKLVTRINRYAKSNPIPRIAYVAMISSLRNTVGDVLKSIRHFHKKTAKGPSDIVKECTIDCNGNVAEKFDVLFVDESHRLCQRKSISWMGSYDQSSKKLYGDNTDPNAHTTLDWLVSCSRTRVLVYDDIQTVKDSDITPCQFESALGLGNPVRAKFVKTYELTQQMRCRAGVDYVQFINDLFDCNASSKTFHDSQYELALYEDPNALIDAISNKNLTYGLSRVTTGYGWQWNSKKYGNCKNNYLNDIPEDKRSRKAQLDYYKNHLSIEDGLIEFSGKKYVRNLDFNWILEGDPREIGCIHTSQGYDLNYVGLIFSPEIDYDPAKKKIVIDKTKIQDTSISKNNDYIDLYNYIINAYKVMMERGIRGCYIYAHNKNLQNYLRNIIQPQQEHGTVSAQQRQEVVSQPVEYPFNIPGFKLEVEPDLQFTSYLPLYTIQAACGLFAHGEIVEKLGWVKAEGVGRLNENMCVVQANGRSMEPRIYGGDLCVFEKYIAGSREGEIVLAEHREDFDEDNQGAYSIKKYHSEKMVDPDGWWQHTKIQLLPLNKEYEPIEITEENASQFKIAGLYKGKL